MADGVPYLEGSAETVGGDIEGVDEYRSNNEGLQDGVQGSGTDSAAVHQRNLGGDGGNIEDPGGVSPQVNQKDCRNDGKTCGGWDMIIYSGGGSARSSGLMPHAGVNV